MTPILIFFNGLIVGFDGGGVALGWWRCFRVVALFDGGLIWFWFDGGLTVVALSP